MMIARDLPRFPSKRRVASKQQRTGRKRILTIKQIESRYPGEWILIKDPLTDKHLRVLKGEVVSHSKDRDEVYRAAIDMRLKRSATLYTGTMPENSAIVL